MNYTLRFITKYHLRKNINLINQRNGYFNKQIYQSFTQTTLLRQNATAIPNKGNTGVLSDTSIIDPRVLQVQETISKLINESADLGIEGSVTLKKVLELKNQLKLNSLTPTVSIYESILSAYAKTKDSQQIIPLLEEMDKEGVKPSRIFYHKALIQIAKEGDSVFLAKVLDKMDSDGIFKTSKTYSIMIRCMRNNLELERALDTVEEMEKLKLIPSLNAYLDVAELCVLANESSLAYSILRKAELSYELTEKQNHYYMLSLRCAVLSDDYKVLKDIWDTCVNKKQIKPDLGLCNYAMIVAARLEDPHLAYDILHTIQDLGYPYSEHHFHCLLEAFTSTLDMKNTFLVFNAMRKAGIIPTIATSSSVAQKLGTDMNAIHRAKEALREIENVDIVAFNLVIHAYAYNGNFEESMSTFAMAKELNVIPNIDTLNSLLDACIHARNPDHGVSILNLFKKNGIQPTTATLSKMIVLMCTTEHFEDAFMYLEKIKETGDIPYRGSYYRLIKKLAASNDPRMPMAIEDMKACGYSFSPYLQQYIDDKEELKEKRARKRELLASNLPE